MSVEDTLSKTLIFRDEQNAKALTCQKDIDLFVADNLNEKIPLDGP